jgi:peptide/nickel transport system substrate-binding protein
MAPAPRAIAALCLFIILIAACAPQPSREGGASGQTSSQVARPKVLTLAARDEPSDMGSFSATSGIRGSTNATMISHNALTATDEREATRPQIAVDLPSVDKGTWRLNPDGTMDVTWTIHPNVKWQDGPPLTTADLLFSYEVYRDTDIPNKRGVGVPLTQSATAIDSHTLVVRWSTTYVNANDGDEMYPMPRHLLESSYRGDKEAFSNSRYFTTEFIGLGPYRLSRWESGSLMEFERFDDYYRGRPPLDRVVLKFVPDSNTMLANILAGAVDIVLPPNVEIDTMFEIRARWEGTGNVARADPTGRFRLMDPQHRPEYARPQNAITNTTVRQGLYQAIDRTTMAEVLTQGLAPIADSWIPPDHELRPGVESAIPPFRYDPARAQQLLTQAGWIRGGDGVLVHNQTGESMDIVLRLTQAQGASAGKEKEASIIRDNWQSVGARVQIDVVPPARVGDRQYEATVPGFSLTGNLTPERWYTTRTHSKLIASDENRWGGGNKGGYTNPRVDVILDRLQTTIDARQRLDLHRQLLQEQMGDVALMPLYWESAPIFMVKGVKDSVVGSRMSYRFFEWDKE